MPAEAYIPLITRELEGLKRLADKAIAQLPSEHFFAKPREHDNSVGIIVKHISGNMLSRWTHFLSSDGEKPDRHRDAEFLIFAEDTRESLLAKWEAGWSVLFAALRPLGAQDLERTVIIRSEPLTVLQAINRQLTHYAYHTGQIVYLAKHFAGANWKSLSIPVGESETFNRAPAKYIKKA